MNPLIVSNAEPVTLIGGGEVTPEALTEALRRAPFLVACDGGANFALKNKVKPVAVLGDMDSVEAATLAKIPAKSLHYIAEQETNDFEKALMRIEAPLILGVGFTGGRLDHELAAFSALLNHESQKVILIGAQDVVFLAPKQLSLSLPIGARFSLFPMGEVRGHSQGLKWPIEGIAFAPWGRIGTSNVVSGPVELRFDVRRMLVIVPRAHLDAVIAAL